MSFEIIQQSALPKGIFWFEFEGRRIFNINGYSARPSNKFAAILFQKLPSPGTDFGGEGLHEEFGGRWYVIEFSGNDILENLNILDTVARKVREAIKALQGDKQ